MFRFCILQKRHNEVKVLYFMKEGKYLGIQLYEKKCFTIHSF